MDGFIIGMNGFIIGMNGSRIWFEKLKSRVWFEKLKFGTSTEVLKRPPVTGLNPDVLITLPALVVVVDCRIVVPVKPEVKLVTFWDSNGVMKPLVISTPETVGTETL
jgi:hypothetical protein